MDTAHQAKQQAEAARHQLEGTVMSVKTRLHPKALSQEVAGRAKAKVAELAENSVSAARTRPALTTSIFAAAALFIFRKPVAKLIQKLGTRPNKEKQNG
jgi:regulator of protease activity HflC (stomatin/prohibitin superfamily)